MVVSRLMPGFEFGNFECNQWGWALGLAVFRYIRLIRRISGLGVKWGWEYFGFRVWVKVGGWGPLIVAHPGPDHPTRL